MLLTIVLFEHPVVFLLLLDGSGGVGLLHERRCSRNMMVWLSLIQIVVLFVLAVFALEHALNQFSNLELCNDFRVQVEVMFNKELVDDLID